VTSASTKIIVAVVLSVVMPAVFSVLVLQFVNGQEADLVESEPVYLTPTAGLDDLATSVLLSLSWSEPESASAPPWSGIVTAVGVEIGGVLREGNRVCEIDGVWTIAGELNTPMWRDLTLRDIGKDVEELQHFLARLGFLQADVDGEYGADTASAASRFAESIGVSKPHGDFQQAWVVRIPAGGITVGGIECVVGLKAPEPFSVVVQARARIQDVAVKDGEGKALTESSQGPWEVVLSVEGAPVTVVLENLAMPRADELGDGIPPDSTGLSAIARLQNPVPVLIVPSIAVQAGASGSVCLWVNENGAHFSREVSVRRGDPGTSIITEGLAQHEVFLANPSQVMREPSCP
jgi:hypothetical protein